MQERRRGGSVQFPRVKGVAASKCCDAFKSDAEGGVTPASRGRMGDVEDARAASTMRRRKRLDLRLIDGGRGCAREPGEQVLARRLLLRKRWYFWEKWL